MAKKSPKKNRAVEFAHNIDLSQKIGRITENLKKETRSEIKEELQNDIDNLTYQALVQNKTDLGISDDVLSGITPKDLRENPRYDQLNKLVSAYVQDIPMERASMRLKDGLEGILNDLPNSYRDSIGVDSDFTTALGKNKLVKDYEEVVMKARGYKQLENLTRMYREHGKFISDDPEQAEGMTNAFFAGIADAVGKRFSEKLKKKGYSQDAQNIGKTIAAMSAKAGLIPDDDILKRADESVKVKEKEFREYEKKTGKKLDDYVREGTKIILSEKDTDKYNVGRGLIYGTAKSYIKDKGLEAKDADYFRLLKA
jgi:hypothetical protein